MEIKDKNLYDILFYAKTRSGIDIYWDIFGKLKDKYGNSCCYRLVKFYNNEPYYSDNFYSMGDIVIENIIRETIKIVFKEK